VAAASAAGCRWGAEQSDPAVCRIDVDVVICAVTFQITTAINESAHELAPLHSEIESSCFSFGTNTLSAASFDHQMVSVEDHRLKFFERFALTHDGRHFLQPADVPAVIFPILQRELLHDVDLESGKESNLIRLNPRNQR